ncbi:hypothetical protein cypCar_00016792 [Cyprinus carpio]|nr:hypothetical protein cypCar_00016792 [Cyprinus carpio]
MMTSPSVSMEDYQEAEQMQVGEQTAGQVEERLEEEEEREEEESSSAPSEPQTPMEVYKTAIYRHPLFPLLALLFEKCEQSTQSSECVTSASFDVDIENFVRNQDKEGKAFFSENPDLDNLPLSSFSGAMSPHGIVVPASALQQGNVTVTAVNPTQVVTGGTVYQPVTVVTPQGQVVTQTLSPGTIRIQNSQLQLQLNQDLNFFSQEDNSSKAKRGILPKHATSVMRSWLFQHIGHPYPTEDEKKQIALQTNLTLLQVNNWFINARRRILQPMLDASSSDTPKNKKKTPQTRPLQRFWPNSLAASVSQQQVTMEDGTMVTVGVGEDGLQTLSSDGATLAMQQVMMGGHSEDDDDDEEDEEDEDDDPSHSDMTRLGLETSDSL